MPRRIPSANPYSRDALDFWRSKGIDMEPQIRKLEPHGLSKWAPRVATAGVTAGLGAAAAPWLLGAMGGTAGVTGASVGAPAVTGAAVAAPAARFTLGNILKMAEVGVPG